MFAREADGKTSPRRRFWSRGSVQPYGVRGVRGEEAQGAEIAEIDPTGAGASDANDEAERAAAHGPTGGDPPVSHADPNHGAAGGAARDTPAQDEAPARVRRA